MNNSIKPDTSIKLPLVTFFSLIIFLFGAASSIAYIYFETNNSLLDINKRLYKIEKVLKIE